jgi:predicted transcriptional regulator
MKFQKRVHIIVIGDDNVDRAVNPARSGRADRVYLITMEGKDLFLSTFEKVKKELMKDVISKNEIKEIRINLFDFSIIIQKFAEIIKKEHDNGNIVFISISTGGNLIAAAGMLACILFHAKPYFCQMDYETGTIPDDPEFLPIPKYKIEPPAKLLIQFLYEIEKVMNEKRTSTISKGLCLKIMELLHPDEEFSKTPGDYNKLKFRYLDKLEVAGFIAIEKNKPRAKIMLTNDGKFAIQVFSVYYGFKGEIHKDFEE